MQKKQKRRLRWLGALTLTALIAAAVFFFPRGLRGPESVASAYLEVLMQAPDDFVRLRSAAHLLESDDPLAGINDLPTRIALEFLHARERQGVGHDLRIVERRRPAAQRYAVTLEVTERSSSSSEPAPARRFAIAMQQRDDGDWRVAAISAIE